jgi:hypothetical protein
LPLLASCSLVFVRGPDPDPPCTSSYAAPVLDGVVGATALLSTLAVAIGCAFEAPTDRGGCHLTEALVAGGGVVLVTSSIVGSYRVNRCKDARSRTAR